MNWENGIYNLSKMIPMLAEKLCISHADAAAELIIYGYDPIMVDQALKEAVK